MFIKPPGKSSGNKSQKQQVKPPSTQEHLPLAEIKKGVVILKDGSLRTIMMVSTINFDLKSEEEQNALIFGYMRFLNSLEFPIQIVMQSRRMDLTEYLAKLDRQSKNVSNPLMQIQIQDYIDFIKRLLKIANIMDKRFYVIIPFYPNILVQAKQGSWDKIKNALSGKQSTINLLNFEQNCKELEQRAQIAASGLGSLGLRAVQLNTQEIVELLYLTYNPDLAVREKLIPLDQISTQTEPTPPVKK